MYAVILLIAACIGLAWFALSGDSAAGAALPQVAMLLGAFVLFFGSGIFVGAALGLLGLLAGAMFSGRPFWTYIGQMVWGPATNFVLVAVPLFLLMGEIMLRAGSSERLYRSLNTWLRGAPGGLLHTNIAASSLFSAISGSSVATAATMGSVALPFFKGAGYSSRMVLGSLAAGGALGNLIPPGLSFIIYALITDTSVGALYLAAVGPSILVVALFTLIIAARGGRGNAEEGSAGWSERVAALVGLLPTLALVALVLGTIYAGLATPTESAALGVVGAIVLAAGERRLSVRMILESCDATARTTSFIGFILFGAYILNYILSSLGLPQQVANFVSSLPLPPWAIMAAIIGLYLALGTFMEGTSMIVTTIPVIFPLVVALGYDPVWFGVVVTMLIEIAMISPPDGTVLYVLQGMRRDGGPITDVFAGVMPFMGVYILAIVIMMLWPDLSLWLPRVAR